MLLNKWKERLGLAGLSLMLVILMKQRAMQGFFFFSTLFSICCVAAIQAWLVRYALLHFIRIASACSHQA